MTGKINTPPVPVADGEEKWETLDEGIQPHTITFDAIGDVFIGVVLRSKKITDEAKGDTWDQFQFTGVSPAEITDELCAVNASKRLADSLETVPVGNLVRIEFTDAVPIKGQVSPMKLFKVQHRSV